MKMGASSSNVLKGCAGNEVAESVVPCSPQRSLTRKPGGTTNCRRHSRWRAREGVSLCRRLPSAQPRKDQGMRVIHERCAGLDVHKKSVYAFAVWAGEEGNRKQEIRSFGTMTADLLQLADWLREHQIAHVAME